MCKFKVGQKVVCINANKYILDLPGPPVVKDSIYTILNIVKGHCGWLVDVGIASENMNNICKCGHVSYKPVQGIYWVLSDRFAPIEPRRVEISIGVAYPETQERLDVVKTSEPCTQ